MANSALIKKLGIKPGHGVLVLNASDGYIAGLGPLPDSADVETTADGTVDFVQALVHSNANIDSHAVAAVRALKPGGVL